MIQRVQSVYFFLAIICLGLTCTGMEFFRFVEGDTYYSFSVYGIQKGVGNELSMYKAIPLYLSVIGMCLFAFITLMSYKNIKKQLKWARNLFFLYSFILIAIIVFSLISKSYFFESGGEQELGLGYLFLVAGLPFCFLAQIAVKRDKKLLDSLNRLR